MDKGVVKTCRENPSSCLNKLRLTKWKESGGKIIQPGKWQTRE